MTVEHGAPLPAGKIQQVDLALAPGESITEALAGTVLPTSITHGF